MVDCDNCAYKNFCYGVNKYYCPRFTYAMISYSDKTTNTNDRSVTNYSITNNIERLYE